MIKIHSKYCSYITIYFYSLQFSLIFLIFSKHDSETVVSRSWKRLCFFKFNGSFFLLEKMHSFFFTFSYLCFLLFAFYFRYLNREKTIYSQMWEDNEFLFEMERTWKFPPFLLFLTVTFPRFPSLFLSLAVFFPRNVLYCFKFSWNCR